MHPEPLVKLTLSTQQLRVHKAPSSLMDKFLIRPPASNSGAGPSQTPSEPVDPHAAAAQEGHRGRVPSWIYKFFIRGDKAPKGTRYDQTCKFCGVTFSHTQTSPNWAHTHIANGKCKAKPEQRDALKAAQVEAGKITLENPIVAAYNTTGAWGNALHFAIAMFVVMCNIPFQVGERGVYLQAFLQQQLNQSFTHFTLLQVIGSIWFKALLQIATSISSLKLPGTCHAPQLAR